MKSYFGVPVSHNIGEGVGESPQCLHSLPLGPHGHGLLRVERGQLVAHSLQRGVLRREVPEQLALQVVHAAPVGAPERQRDPVRRREAVAVPRRVHHGRQHAHYGHLDRRFLRGVGLGLGVCVAFGGRDSPVVATRGLRRLVPPDGLSVFDPPGKCKVVMMANRRGRG